jgi:hypothetical protein
MMTPTERYELIKLARESLEFGKKLLAQAGCKLVVNTGSDAGAIDVVPEEVDFKGFDELGRKQADKAEDTEDFLASAPLGIDVTSVYANGDSKVTDVPKWWAGVIEAKREETAKLLGFRR